MIIFPVLCAFRNFLNRPDGPIQKFQIASRSEKYLHRPRYGFHNPFHVKYIILTVSAIFYTLQKQASCHHPQSSANQPPLHPTPSLPIYPQMGSSDADRPASDGLTSSVQEFCRTSSAHGLGHLPDSSGTARFAWFLIVVALMVALFYNVGISLYREAVVQPVKTENTWVSRMIVSLSKAETAVFWGLLCGITSELNDPQALHYNRKTQF